MQSFREKWVNRIFKQTRKRARCAEITINITLPYLYRKWDQQKGFCSLTGIEFHETEVQKGEKRPYIPSLDRINRRRGYMKGNVRFVCNAVNMALFTWGDEVFDHVVRCRTYNLDTTRRERACLPPAEDHEYTPPVYQYCRSHQSVYLRDTNWIGPDGLISQGRVEGIYQLCSGWFNQRRKRQLPTPPCHSTQQVGKQIRYRFDTECVKLWFEEHPDAVSWEYETYINGPILKDTTALCSSD